MYLVESGFSKENQDQIKEGWDTVKLMVDRIRKMCDVKGIVTEQGNKVYYVPTDANYEEIEIVPERGEVLEPVRSAPAWVRVADLPASNMIETFGRCPDRAWGNCSSVARCAARWARRRGLLV